MAACSCFLLLWNAHRSKGRAANNDVSRRTSMRRCSCPLSALLAVTLSGCATLAVDDADAPWPKQSPARGCCRKWVSDAPPLLARLCFFRSCLPSLLLMVTPSGCVHTQPLGVTGLLFMQIRAHARIAGVGGGWSSKLGGKRASLNACKGGEFGFQGLSSQNSIELIIGRENW